LTEGHDWKFITYCVRCCNTLTVAEIQRRFGFVRVQIESQGARNVTKHCAFRALQVHHTKTRFI
jgi:hypothetical protein